MLHILLLILKMIGIILAVILGILVLLVCIVIFAPVRYEINGRCGGTLSSLKVKGKITWLFSLVRADIYYKENKLKWRLRIAWKKSFGGQEYKGDTSLHGMPPGEADAQNKRTEGEEDEKKNEEIWWSETGEGKESEKIEENDDKAWYQSGEDEEGSEEFQEEFSEDEEMYEEIPKSSKGFLSKIKGIYSRIKCTIRNICDKIKELLEKKNKLIGFIQDESHRGAFRKAKKEVCKLLRRLRPKNFLLEARFGFEDPAWTGRTVAAAAPFYPFFGEFVSLQPDFTKKILEGKLCAKGRICLRHFAALAWNLLWSKNIRRTYRDIKNFEL